jgi:hypothetical protein
MALSMVKTGLLLLAYALAPVVAAGAEGPAPTRVETVVVPSGTLKLQAQLWHPEGRGPFPAVLFNHGSGRGNQHAVRLS